MNFQRGAELLLGAIVVVVLLLVLVKVVERI